MIALPIGIVATAFANEIHRRDFVVTWGMVARVPLFAGLTAGEIADVMRDLSAQTFAAGDIVSRRGEPARSMYFIASGEVDIDLPGKQPVRLGVGHFFGEIALLRRARRSGTVTAVSRTHLLVLKADDLHSLMERDTRLGARIRAIASERFGQELAGAQGDIFAPELTSEGDSPG